jgi:hypothetical protein
MAVGGGGGVTAVQMAQSVPAKSPKARNTAPPAGHAAGPVTPGSQRPEQRHRAGAGGPNLSNSAALSGENDGRMAARRPSPRFKPT